MFKKSLAVFLTIAMSLSLAACGAKSDPAPKETASTEVTSNEVVAEVADKVEQPETKTEEPAVQEEPKTDGAPVQPTSRTQYMSSDGANPIEIPETIEYAPDGSYTVTGTYVDKNRDCSYDIVHTYNEKGELINYILREYGAAFPDGREQEVKLISGYPTWVTYDSKGSAKKTDTIEDYTADFTSNEGISVQNGKITSNYMINYAVDELGHSSPEFYAKGSTDGKRVYNGNRTIGDSRLIDDFGLSGEEQLSSIVEYKDNALIISYVYQGEGYNLETRKNEMMNVYDSVDVLRYNQQGLLESIETFKYFKDKASSIDINDLSGFEPNSYAYYTYDSNGNLLDVRGRAAGGFEKHITYDYGNETSATESVSSSDSTSDLASVIVGTWKDKTGLNDVSFEFYEDGTGRENLGGAILFDYTVNGDEVTLVMRAGKIPNSVLKYQDGKLVAGDMKVEKIN